MAASLKGGNFTKYYSTEICFIGHFWQGSIEKKGKMQTINFNKLWSELKDKSDVQITR